MIRLDCQIDTFQIATAGKFHDVEEAIGRDRSISFLHLFQLCSLDFTHCLGEHFFVDNDLSRFPILFRSFWTWLPELVRGSEIGRDLRDVHYRQQSREKYTCSDDMSDA